MPRPGSWPVKRGMGRALITSILILLAVLAATACAPMMAQEGVERPNIILVLTDDMRKDDLEHMPRTRNLIADQGMTFSNAFVTQANCCPSRATILRGQYPHNHGVLNNSPPKGGFPRFKELGRENSTIATWLNDDGYRTVLLGKYLNGYPTDDPTYIPPGWDEWYASVDSGYYDYKLNENGTVVSYGSAGQDYLTDVLGVKAQDYVRRTVSDPAPFFMYLAPAAPHHPYTPAPRHEGATPEDVRVPRHAGQFNEKDMGDKPSWARELPRLNSREVAGLDANYRKRLNSLLAVDEMVAGLVEELDAAGELDNTYIVFTSDNGYHMGEHRLAEAKKVPYKESIRVPLVIWGPGIPAGRTTGQFALNNDLAPTFADLGAASTPGFVDGRSLKPLFAADAPDWRTAFLVQHWFGGPGDVSIPYKAVRTSQHKYIRYSNTKEKELYNLGKDPYETRSIHRSASESLMGGLRSRLTALKGCAAESCREAEDGP